MAYEIGSEFDWNSNVNFLKKSSNAMMYANKEFCFWKYLRSGRDAFRYIARNFKNQSNYVLLPALCCISMTKPFIDEGYNIKYYKLTQSLEIDIEDAKSKIKDNCIFIYMNFFSINAINESDLESIKNMVSNITFVEDITHDFLERIPIKSYANIVVCSIRKWFAIPDGGILLSKKKLNNILLENDEYFERKRTLAMKLKSKYLLDSDINIKNKYRELLKESNDYLDKVQNISKMCKKSFEIFNKIDVLKIYNRRLNNSYFLQDSIKNQSMINIIHDSAYKSTLYYPIILQNEQVEVEKKLCEYNIYAPIIWPLPESAKGICKTSDYISEHILALPCDHRYSIHDMKYSIDALFKIIKF